MRRVRCGWLALIVAVSLSGCDERLPRAEVTPSAPLTATAVPPAGTPSSPWTWTPVPATPTPTRTPTPVPMRTPSPISAIRGWLAPPPTGVPIVDQVIADIFRRDAEALRSRFVGSPVPCTANPPPDVFENVVCPEGVEIGTPIPALAGDGGCHGGTTRLDLITPVLVQWPTARQWMPIMAGRYVPNGSAAQPKNQYYIWLASVDNPREGASLVLEDRGITASRPMSFGVAMCGGEGVFEDLFTGSGAGYLIPRAP